QRRPARSRYARCNDIIPRRRHRPQTTSHMRKKLILLALVVAVAAGSLTCSPVYVLRAGIEEARILSRRQPIEEIVRNPATDEETRRKLELVLQARTFASDVLQLDAGDSYTTYSWIDRDTL